MSLVSRLVTVIVLLTLSCGAIQWYEHGFLEGVKIIATLATLIVATFLVSLWVSKGD